MGDYIRGIIAMFSGLGLLASLALLGYGIVRSIGAGNWLLPILWIVLWVGAIAAGIRLNRWLERQLIKRRI